MGSTVTLPGEGDTGAARHDEPLFPAEVLFHRQPVAWVLGETLDAARRGAARVRVEYEELPAILTIPQAIAANSYLTDALTLARGDISAMRSPRILCSVSCEAPISSSPAKRMLPLGWLASG